MSKMKKISTRILSDSERLELLAHLILTLQQFGVEDSYITKMIAKLLGVQSKLDVAIHKSRASGLSVEIEELNTYRKKLLTDIRMGLRFVLREDDEDILRAAKDIEKLYKKSFDGMDLDKNSDLNAGIKTFLDYMEHPRSVESYEKILLSGKVVKLTATNNKFIQLIQSRAEAEELDDSPNLLPTRDELKLLYNSLLEIVNFNIYCGESDFEELAQKLNGRIGEIVAIAKSRNTHEQNEEEEEDVEE